ncbi:MAG: hypothetical protein JKX85_07325 [Phycisphaeraceae bacterium]|nr:hypothetical protein [Phycisphaeraceae bacterium]
MGFRKVLTHCCVAALLLTTGFVHTASAKPLTVLSQIHEDADAVVIVPSLRQLSDKMTLIANELGMGAQLPPDPLLMFQMMSGLSQGLDKDGNIAIVIWNLQAVMDAAINDQPAVEPDVALLIPVTKAQDFMANFAGSEVLDNGLTRVGAMGQSLLVKPLGDQYILAGQNQNSLLKYKAANADQWTVSQGKVAADYTGKSDLVLLINPKSLANVFNKNMDMLLDDIKKNMDQAQETSEKLEAMGPILDYYLKLMFKATGALLNDTTGIAVGLTISKAGISTGLSMQFKQGSTLNQILAMSPKSLGQFDSLPDLPWISLAYADASQLDNEKLINLSKELILQDAMVPEKAQQILTAFNKIIENYKLYNYSYQQMQVANPAGQTQMVTAFPCPGESKEVFNQVRQMMEPVAEIFSAFMNLKGDEKGLMNMSFKQDAVQIKGGTQTDILTLSSDDEIFAKAFMQSLGSSKIDIYTSYNDAGMVSVVGGEQLLEQSLVALTDKKVLPATQNMVNTMRPNLPANRLAEVYLNLPNYIQHMQATMLKQSGGAQVAMMMGMLQLPTDLPPVAGTVSNIDGGVRIDSFTPMQTITVITQKGMVLGQMMGGAPGNAPGNAPASEPAPFN